MRYVLLYLICVNAAAFVIYGADKRKAARNKWRIPEATLLLTAAVGGSLGALAGMRVFHHKTKKKKFSVGVPVILVLQIAAFCVIFM